MKDQLDAMGRTLGRGRVLRDGEPVTAEAVARIADNAGYCLKRAGKTVEQLAGEIGQAPAELAAVLRGEPGHDAALRDADRWVEGQLAKVERPIHTGILDRGRAGFKWAAQNNAIVLECGATGIGKTPLAMAMAGEVPGAIYFAARAATASPRAILQEICRAARIEGGGGTAYGLLVAVETALKGSDRFLIADNLQSTLVGRRKEAALQILLDVHKSTHIPMVWMGLPSLAAFLRAGQGRESVNQIATEIALWLDLDEAVARGGGAPMLETVEGVRRMLAARQIRITPDGLGYLARLAEAPEAGGLRAVGMVLDFAARLAGGRVIDAEMLRSIQAQRLGMQGAEALERRMELHTAKVA